MTEVFYDKSQSQKDYETKYIINPIKQMVPKTESGRNLGIKLPEYIFFTIDDENVLHIDIKEFRATQREGTSFMKNPTCENMQTDNTAFEGWAICLKAWLKTINTVKLAWAIPSEKNLHYNRFLYRALRFSEAFPDWFMVDDRNKEEVQNFQGQLCNLTNNSYKEKPKEKKRDNAFGETEMEFLMVTKFAGQMTTSYQTKFVDRQLPVGLKKSGKQFFTGGMSAIDIWGLADNTMTIIELKYGTKNIKVGIISELFLYSCVARDIAKGIIGSPITTPKETEKQLYEVADTIKSIKAEMLATHYHPLIENNEAFNLLNNNAFKTDIGIYFNKSTYTYDILQEKLEIKA